MYCKYIFNDELQLFQSGSVFTSPLSLASTLNKHRVIFTVDGLIVLGYSSYILLFKAFQNGNWTLGGRCPLFLCTGGCGYFSDAFAGIDFTKIEIWVFLIEIALSICTLCLCSTFTPQKASQKLGIKLYAVGPTSWNQSLV